MLNNKYLSPSIHPAVDPLAHSSKLHFSTSPRIYQNSKTYAVIARPLMKRIFCGQHRRKRVIKATHSNSSNNISNNSN